MAAVMIVIFAYWLFPLRSTARAMQVDLLTMEQEITMAKSLIKKYTSQYSQTLLAREEVSLAIDKITQLGEQYHVEFASIMPKEIESITKAPYSKLSITMDLKGLYQDLGQLLGQLNQLNQGTLTIKKFKIKRDEEILPLVRLQLTAEIYLYDD